MTVVNFQLLMRQLWLMVVNLRGSHNNQNVIRKHLYHYFKNGKLTQFPSKHCTEISASTIFKIEIHCHCRMPELKTTPMIECKNCCKWYHTVCCQGIPKKYLDDSIVPWLCSSYKLHVRTCICQTHLGKICR